MHHILPSYLTATLPGVYDRKRLERTLDEWRQAVGERRIPANERAAIEAFLGPFFANSPYLGRLILRDPAFALKVLARPPDEVLNTVLETAAEEIGEAMRQDRVMSILRQAKARASLLIAVADIAGLWDLTQVCAALSRLAESALTLTLDFLIGQRISGGELAPRADATKAIPAARQCGCFILAMGKLGAEELNFSSDIDLIVLFDAGAVRYLGRKSLQDCMSHITRDLVRLMQERTAEGYVFRTDLRLRHDAGATPVAMSVDAAEVYYQSVGLNWERAAMIKARAVAGDLKAARAFTANIQPFIWRRHLDFTAIQDIHAIKRLTHSHKGHRKVAFAGHDIKLGAGGIREIEFFAQTQQLIAGGRDSSLRTPATVDALAALCRAGWIDRKARDELTGAYRFLRRLEHRLQMIDDAQTHSLPESRDDLARVAAFMGYADTDGLREAVLGALIQVHRRYEKLFAGDGESSAAATPCVPHPAAASGAENLAAMGYGAADESAAIVANWRRGRYRACRSSRARSILARLTPILLRALAAGADPDGALRRFDEFLSKLPAGVQLFSLFQANPWLLDLVAEIMGGAPGLAESLSRNVLLLDAVLSPDFFTPLPDRRRLAASLDEALSGAGNYEDILDIARRWVAERKFRIGVQVLRNTMDGVEAGRGQAALAETVLNALLPRVEDAFAERHGRLPGDGLAVLALGKLGGQELTPTSDLDLTFIYDPGPGDSRSDGPQPLPTSQYYGRLSQRLISALTALTSEGRLYEVDMRLRPSGRAGPLAVSFDAFFGYQRDRAWTWEHLALTRARVIAGKPGLSRRIDHALRAVLCRHRYRPKLAAEVLEMRRRLEDEFPGNDIWDLKTVRGGQQDIEFIAQFLQLYHASTWPDVLSTGTATALGRLGSFGLIGGELTVTLIEAARLYQNIQGFLRLCLGTRTDVDNAPPGLKLGLAKAAKHAHFRDLREHLKRTQMVVLKAFGEIIGETGKETMS